MPIGYGRNICVKVGCFKFVFSNPLRTPAPNKNESYDTIGIATFVLFFLSKLPVTQGFGAMWQKRIVSLSYPPALISMLFRGVLTPCSDAEIHNETFLKRIISL